MFLHAVFKLTIVFVDQHSAYKHYKPYNLQPNCFMFSNASNSEIHVRTRRERKNINKLICGLKSIKLQQWKLIVINHEKEIYDFDDDVLLPILSRAWSLLSKHFSPDLHEVHESLNRLLFQSSTFFFSISVKLCFHSSSTKNAATK